MKAKKIFKSLLAILAGMISGAVLSILTDMILQKAGVFPLPEPGLFLWWMLFIALVYRGIYTIVSGYITARLAPNRPIRHAFILGMIGVVITLIGTIVNWDSSAGWYPVTLLLITLPCTWLGGILFAKKSNNIA